MVSSACAACGVCCRSYIVSLCGRDVWQISRRQQLAPQQFIMAVARKTERPDGFHLESGGDSMLLMLDKQGRFGLKRPCVFLVQLAGEYVTCGIYEHRPMVCRTYPFVSRADGVLGMRDKPLCPPAAWDGVDANRWRDTIDRAEFEFDLYGEVMARWNARVEHAPGRRFGLNEYLSYLLNAYDAIAELDAGLGEDGLRAVVHSWRTAPDPAPSLEELRYRPDEYPWADYVFRVHDIIGRFYPDVPRAAVRRFLAMPGTLSGWPPAAVGDG